MSLDDWRLVFVSALLILALCVFGPFTMAYFPRSEERFFALAVLGEEGMAEKYYPGDDPNIGVGETVNWTLYIYNHMGEAQYVAVRVKLLNSTIPPPNSTACVPSPAPMVYEIRDVLLHNETRLHPFSWSIEEAGRSGDFVGVSLLSVNGDLVKADAFSEDGFNFRFVFELWVFDEKSDDFRFGWRCSDESLCTWNQIWFNATLTVG
jgi:hypothetical protein